MKTKTTAMVVGFLIVLGGLLSGPVAGRAEVADRIVAIVNDDIVTLSELNKAMAPYIEKLEEANYPPDKTLEMRFKIREDVLNKLIEDNLVNQETKKANITVGDEEVNQRIEETKKQHRLTEEDLVHALKAQGYTLEEYRKALKEQILRMKLISIEVKSKIAITEKDIERYYEDHQDEFGGASKYHLRTILVRVSPESSAEDKSAAQEKIKSVEGALKVGGPGSFAELATRFSEDTSSVRGGDLGMFSVDMLSEELQKVVRGMEEGEISPVMETPAGYQILMVQEIKRTAGKTLEEARPDIQQALYGEVVDKKYKAWVKELRDRSYVKINR